MLSSQISSIKKPNKIKNGTLFTTFLSHYIFIKKYITP